MRVFDSLTRMVFDCCSFELACYDQLHRFDHVVELFDVDRLIAEMPVVDLLYPGFVKHFADMF